MLLRIFVSCSVMLMAFLTVWSVFNSTYASSRSRRIPLRACRLRIGQQAGTSQSRSSLRVTRRCVGIHVLLVHPTHRTCRTARKFCKTYRSRWPLESALVSSAVLGAARCVVPVPVPRYELELSDIQSSLTLSLLRCILTEGSIRYDGLLTEKVNLDALRSNMTIIPQVVRPLTSSRAFRGTR